jgi:hypothetical protein
MKPGEVRRDGEDTLAWAQLLESLRQALAQIIGREPIVNGTTGIVEHGTKSSEVGGIVGASLLAIP